MKRTFRQFLLPTTFVVLAILVLMPAAPASALTVEQDCGDSDQLEHNHSEADLRAALDDIQADLAEYGTCRQMILAKLAEMTKDAKKSDGGGPSAPAADLDGDGVVTPEEKAIVAKKAKQKRKKQNQEIAAVSDELVQDSGTATSDGGSGGTSLPLILAIVALLGAGVGGGVWYAAKRNPAVANALRRVSPPFGNS